MNKTSPLVVADVLTSRKFFAVLLLALSCGCSAQASSYTWTGNGGTTSWTVTSDWSGNPGFFPTNAGDTANLTNSPASNQTVNLGAAITVGTLNIGDSTGNASFIVNPNSGSLTLNNSGAGASINEVGGTLGLGDSITAPIIIADTLSNTITSNGVATDILTISGGITGSANLTLKANGVGAINLTTAAINNSGSITNSGSSTGTVTISGGVGTNVSTINQNSATSALTISTTALTVNGSGTTVNSIGAAATTISGGVVSSPTGNLILDANSTGTITLSTGSVNNSGAVINSGSGSGSTTISAVIGVNVTGVTENSTVGPITTSTTANNGTGSVGANSIVVANAAGFAVGGSIVGTGIAPGTTITAVAGTTVSLSIPTTAAVTTGGINTTVNGSNLLLTNTANTFTGTISDLGGTLLYSGPNSFGNAGNSILLGNTSGSVNSALESNLITAASVVTRNITVQSGNTGTATIGENSSATYTIAGNITLGTASGTGHGVTLQGVATGTQNFSAAIADPTGLSGAGGLVTVSTLGSTIELSGANTFTGGVNFVAGNLSLNSATALGAGTLTINGGNFNQVTAGNIITNTNAQVWDQDFSYTGALALNLGAGAVNLGALSSDNPGTGGLTSANAIRTVSVNTGGTLTVGGIISNGTNLLTNGLTKAGAGTLVLNGANTYTGGTTINNGMVSFGSGAAPSSGLITINSGGTLNSGGAFSNVVNWLGSGLIASGSTGDIALTGGTDTESLNFSGYNNLMLGASTASTFTGTITPVGGVYRLGGGGAILTLSNNTLTGGNSLVVGAVTPSNGSNTTTLLNSSTTTTAGASTGTVQLTNSNSMSGATTVNSGTLNLSASSSNTFGALPNSAITDNSSTLAIDSNNATTIPASVTRAASLTLNSGTVTDTGTTIANSDDVITGAITLASGSSTITVNPVTGTGKNTELSAGSLVQDANAFAFVNGVGLGKAAVGAANDANIILGAAPTLVGTTTGSALSATDTTLNLVIVPYLVGAGSGTAGTGGTASATPNTFVTYDSTFGLRPLDVSDEYATGTNLVAGTAGNDNVRVTAAATTTASSSFTINSLVMATATSATLSILDTHTLIDTSGALLFVNSGVIAPSTSSGALTFGASGAAQGVITVDSAQTGTISAVISGTGGLVKLGPGTLSLSAANTYTSTTAILNGVASISNISAFGGDSSAILVGDTSGSNNTGITTSGITLSRNLIIQGGNTGVVTLQDSATSGKISGTVTLGSGGIGHGISVASPQFDNFTISGNIVDPAGLTTGTAGIVTIVGSNSDVILSGTNTYTGGTILSAGELQVTNSSALGTGTLTIDGGSFGGPGFGGGAEPTIANNQIWNASFGAGVSAGSGLATTGSILMTTNITLGLDNTSYSESGVISDGGNGYSLTLNTGSTAGASTTYFLGGANTFGGGLKINSSSIANDTLTVDIDNGSALGTGTVTLNTNVGPINFSNASGAAEAMVANNAEIWNGNFSSSGFYMGMGTGAVSLGSSAAATRTLTITGDFETDGVISNGTNAVTPTINLTKAGAGALVLGGNSTYTGATTLSAGVLQFGNGGTSGSIANSPGASLVDPSGGTLIIDRSDSFALSSSIIGNSGLVSGAGGFDQAGTGILTINNAQTYSGATAVIGGGTLSLTGGSGSLNGATGTALTFSNLGGKFVYNNAGNGTNSQSMGALTTSAGENTVQATYGASGTTTLTFGSLTARTAGATLNFVGSGGTVGTPGTAGNNVINFTTSPGTGFISAGDFFNGSNYAYYDTTATPKDIRGIDYGVDASSESITTASTAAFTGGELYEQVIGAGSITTQGSQTITTLNLANSNTFTLAGGATLKLDGILESGGNTTIITGGTALESAASGAELVIRTNASNDTLDLETPILANGANALTKSGAGTLILGGTAGTITNTYTGTTTLDAGTLDINSTGALGSGGAFVINSGTTIDNTSGGSVTTSTHALTLDGDFTFGGTNALTLITTGASVVSLGINEESSRVITTNGANALTIAGNIINGTNAVLPTFGLTKAGSGTLALTGENSYTGATVVNTGTLVVSGSTAISAFSVTGATQNNSSQTISVLSPSVTANLVIGELVTGGIGTPAGSFITSISSTSITISGTSNGVSSSNTSVNFGAYGALGSGPVVVNGGTLQLGNGTTNAALVSAQTIADDATVVLDNNGTAQTLANAISGTGVVDEVAGTVTLTGASTYTGGTGIYGGSTLIVGATNTLPTAGAVTLGFSNNTDGTLQLGNGSGAFNQTVSSLTTTGSGTTNAVVGGNSSVSTLTVNPSSADPYAGALGGSGTNQNNLALAKTGAGSFALGGTSANAYSGGTTVLGGTLYANNAVGSTGTGNVAVSNTATLSGTGAIAPTGNNGITVANGGSLTPGGVQPLAGALVSPNGSLTINTTSITASDVILSASQGSGLTFALGAGGAGPTNSATSVSQLLVTGNVANIMNFNVGGTSGTSTVVTIDDLVGSALTLTSLPGAAGSVTPGVSDITEYVLIAGNDTTYGGLTLGANTVLGQQITGGLTLLGPTPGNTFSNQFASAELFLDGDNIVLAVPEPGTWALMLGGFGLLVFFQRRKSRQS